MPATEFEHKATAQRWGTQGSSGELVMGRKFLEGGQEELYEAQSIGGILRTMGRFWKEDILETVEILAAERIAAIPCWGRRKLETFNT
jgi:hypothetical protein